MPMILDGTLGETFPSWTTATRPTAPAPGQVGFNSTTSSLECYNGSNWVVGGLITPSTSGNVLTSDGTSWTSAAPSGLGVGQTWQIPSRAGGTTYTNSTGKPIQVTISFSQGLSGSGSATVVVSGVTISSTSYSTTASGGGLPYTYSFIVPNGATYSISVSGNTSLGTWAELR